MHKNLAVFLCLPIGLLAYSDLDMDGVDDAIDRCPNTSMTELVDIHGCTIKNLESAHRFDIIVGASYSQINPAQEKTDTLSSSVQADYYYKNFSLQASTGYFNSDSSITTTSGQSDSFLGAYYQLNPLKLLTFRLGGGLILPTYDSGLDNNKMDYSVSADVSYLFKGMNLFGSVAYTLINDDDTSYLDTNGSTVTLVYQNTFAFNAGIGFYPTDRLYTSLAYNHSDSIYKTIEDSSGVNTLEPLETVSAYLFYTIDKNWFTTVSYAYGLSDTASDHFAALRVGYYF